MIERIEALIEKATPGPWEAGNIWTAGVMPDRYGPGRCGFCVDGGTPLWVGVIDINGTRMKAHDLLDNYARGCRRELRLRRGRDHQPDRHRLHRPRPPARAADAGSGEGRKRYFARLAEPRN
jgi:hypothetical protein